MRSNIDPYQVFCVIVFFLLFSLFVFVAPEYLRSHGNFSKETLDGVILLLHIAGTTIVTNIVLALFLMGELRKGNMWMTLVFLMVYNLVGASILLYIFTTKNFSILYDLYNIDSYEGYSHWYILYTAVAYNASFFLYYFIKDVFFDTE